MDGFPSGISSVLCQKYCLLGQGSVWYREEVGAGSSLVKDPTCSNLHCFCSQHLVALEDYHIQVALQKNWNLPISLLFQSSSLLWEFWFFEQQNVSILGTSQSLAPLLVILPALGGLSQGLNLSVWKLRSSILQPSRFLDSLVVSALLEGAQGLSPWRMGLLKFPVIQETLHTGLPLAGSKMSCILKCTIQ